MIPSFANQQKSIHDSETEESGGLSNGISIHVYSLDEAGAEQDVECRDFLNLSTFLEPMHRCTDAPMHRCTKPRR